MQLDSSSSSESSDSSGGRSTTTNTSVYDEYMEEYSYDSSGSLSCPDQIFTDPITIAQSKLLPCSSQPHFFDGTF